MTESLRVEFLVQFARRDELKVNGTCSRNSASESSLVVVAAVDKW